jgi:hypothetical protein
MPTIVKMPISNRLRGSDYPREISVGASLKKRGAIPDAGNGTLAVNGMDFNPTADRGTATTNIAPEVQYGSGSWIGAVVRILVDLSRSAAMARVGLVLGGHTLRAPIRFAAAGGLG